MAKLQLTVRTPVEVVFDQEVEAVRVPTESGLVGLRRAAEPTILAVEPGLVLVRRLDKRMLLGTAGGLLRCDGKNLQLLTPLAVTGTDARQLTSDLESAMSVPGSEWEARNRLGHLETQILREMPSLGRTPQGGLPGKR